jgi:hypothetical protein
MENEQDMPFQNEGGCALDIFISVQYDFEASTLQHFFFTFHFKQVLKILR